MENSLKEGVVPPVSLQHGPKPQPTSFYSTLVIHFSGCEMRRMLASPRENEVRASSKNVVRVRTRGAADLAARVCSPGAQAREDCER
jgi:hypothetical protein